MNKTEATVNTIMNTLKAQIGNDGMVDVGSGAEAMFNATRKRMNIALALLVSEGYSHFPIWVDKVGEPGEKSVIDVLAYKGATGEEVFKNRSEIQPVKWNGNPKATPELVTKRLIQLRETLGDRSFKINYDIVSRYEQYKKEGLPESEIAAKMGYFRVDKSGNKIDEPSVALLRAKVKIAKDFVKAKMIWDITELNKSGVGNTEIAEKLGISESSVRTLLNEETA